MQKCTIEVFLNGQWQTCCTVSANPLKGKAGSAVIAFNPELPRYERQFLPSLRYKDQFDEHALPHWPSFLLDLIPQGDGKKHLQQVLELKEGDLASDWRLLLTGAINPVGSLRVKEAANAYYDRMKAMDEKWSNRGFTTQEILERSDAFSEYFDAHGVFTAGATSIQGLSPKLLLTKGKDGLWYADATLPDEKAEKHYIIKFSRARNLADWTILQHEAHYLYLAQEMGLLTAELPQWQSDVLFIPRFDRTVVSGKVIRHHQESLVSLADMANTDTVLTHQLMLKTLCRFVDQPYDAVLEYIKRDIMNLALGNPDNSPYNTAVQTINGKTAIAPLYDFAPMYLDMDAISRSLEWIDDAGNQLNNWADILAALPLNPSENAQLRQDLKAFGQKMGKLEALMEKIGVNEDIITDRYYGIQNQCFQLSEL